MTPALATPPYVACARVHLNQQDLSIAGTSCAPYLEGMLIRSFLVLLTITSCMQTVEPTPGSPRLEAASDTADVKSPESPRWVDICGLSQHQCLPLDPASQRICDDACMLPSYCMDYYPSDYQWCAQHPDTFDRYYRYCDPNGTPAWFTHCIGRYRP